MLPIIAGIAANKVLDVAENVLTSSNSKGGGEGFSGVLQQL